MSYEVNILVNGSRCKQYHHDGKIFIEAKHGSEYAIEIKNNEWQRILAVCSVDGLDILNGKPATENGNGYVINGLSSVKLDGFRVSNDQVARFVFGAKGGSYAASKEDGSERNVGVIGVRIFSEKVKPLPPPPTVIREEHHHHHHHDHYKYPPYRPYWGDTTIWCSDLGGPTYGSSVSSTLSNAGTDSLGSESTLDFCEMERSAAPSAPKGRSSAEYMSKGIKRSFGSSMKSSAGGQSANVLRAMNCCATPEPKGFDMGTKFGEAKESRVVEVEFEKGFLALTTNIYYASRQSLIEMGVPLGNEKQVSFPEPFKDSKYAEPPKGWRS